MSKTRLAIFGAAFFALSAGTHVYQLMVEWKHLERAVELGILTSSSYALLQFLFILCFVVCVVGLLLRNVPGLITTILGLLGVLIGYAYWYSYSTRWLLGLKKDPFYAQYPGLVPPHSFGLVDAHWWDVVILGLSVALLILILTILFKPRRIR